MPHLEPLCEPTTRQIRVSRPFACELRYSGRGAVWVWLSGELDLASAPQFKQAMDEAHRAAVLVIVDLRDLIFIDSAGVSVIADAHARARRSARRLVFVRGPAQVDRMLELTHLAAGLRVVDLKPVLVSTGAVPDRAAAASIDPTGRPLRA